MNYGHPGQFQLVVFAGFFPTYLLPYFAEGLTHLEGAFVEVSLSLRSFSWVQGNMSLRI